MMFEDAVAVTLEVQTRAGSPLALKRIGNRNVRRPAVEYLPAEKGGLAPGPPGACPPFSGACPHFSATVPAGCLISRSGYFRAFLAGLLVVSTVLTTFSCAEAADEGLDKYNVAVGLYKQSRWKQAAEQFRDFLKSFDKHEKSPLARLYLGLTLINNEDYKGAREELRKFADENRQNLNLGQARYRIGECSYLLDDLPAARTELEGFIRDYPNDPLREHALPYFGDTLLRLGDAAAALRMFDSAIESYPTGKLLEDARFGRARSLESLKRYDDAIRVYQEIATNKTGSRAADAQFHLGASFFERKQFADSVAAYTALIKDFPSSPLVPDARLNAGYGLFQSGQFGPAAQQFQQAAKDPAQQPTAGYWQGRSLKSGGDFAKALEALSSAATFASDKPMLESILYEQGLCERSLQHPAESRGYFERVLSKFPGGELADDSLHALIEMSIETGDLAGADQLLARFKKDFSQSLLKLPVELLTARMELARAGQKLRDKRPAEELNEQYDSAARRFEQVMNGSTIPKTQAQARYYLALTRQMQGNHDQALQLIAPLVEKVLTEPEKNEFTDGLVLQADSYYQTKKYDSAADSIATYISRFSTGRQMARALSLQALIAESRNETEVARSALQRLTTEFPDHPLARLTVQQMAKAAESRGDWVTAGRLYESAYESEKVPEQKAYALRDVAWCAYNRKEYATAAGIYARVVSEFPSQNPGLECRYYQADCLKRIDQLPAAIDVFRKIFESFPADKPVETGDENQLPVEYYYKAGLQVARLYDQAGQGAESDAAYETLLKRFPKPADLDRRLDDWAKMNYHWARTNDDQSRFERADSIWKRLVKEVPLSPLVNNARLSLAESDLLAGRFEEARATFEDLAESASSNDETKELALYQLLVLAVERQRWPDVRTTGKRLVAKFPESQYRYYAVYSEAESYLAATKPDEQDLRIAREKLEFLRDRMTDDAVSKSEWADRVWVLLAEVNFREKKYQDVVTIAEDLKHRKPQSPFIYQTEEIVGRSYKQIPKFDEARAAFQRVLKDPVAYRTETAAKAQFLIGETWFLQQKWDAAATEYQFVYSNYKFPEWQAAALVSAGKCDEEQNEWKFAVETYKRVIKEFPGTIVIDEAKRRLEAAQKRVDR